MGPVNLLSVVSRHNQWLSVRQSLIAGNIANANTPAFKALDAEPFEKVMEETRLSLATTRSGHMDVPGSQLSVASVRSEGAWDVSHSGNNVSLEQELIKAGEINRAYRLNTSIVKAFHRMMLTSAKA
jgi:flagellar basal-body rod protein FlgB